MCGKNYSDLMLRDAITQNIPDARIHAAILKLPHPDLQTALSIIEYQSVVDTTEDNFDLL